MGRFDWPERRWAGVGQEHLRRYFAWRRWSKGHRGIRTLLRSGKWRPPSTHGFSAWGGKWPVACHYRRVHPGEKHAVFGAYRWLACVPAGAHAGAFASWLHRRLQGCFARPVCHWRRVFRRCAGRYLSKLGRRQSQRAAERADRPGCRCRTECDRTRGRSQWPYPS